MELDLREEADELVKVADPASSLTKLTVVSGSQLWLLGLLGNLFSLKDELLEKTGMELEVLFSTEPGDVDVTGGFAKEEVMSREELRYIRSELFPFISPLSPFCVTSWVKLGKDCRRL